MSEETWIRININTEMISTIKFTAELSTKLDIDSSYWKWFIIALHNAIQNTITRSLISINNIPIMKDKHAEKWLESYWKNEPLPKYDIKTLPQLFDKLKRNYKKFNLANRFSSNSTLDWSMERLHGYRNMFLHFIPSGISLSKINIIRVGLDCNDLIEKLLFKSGRINIDKNEHKALKFSINSINSSLNFQKEKYNCCNDINSEK